MLLFSEVLADFLLGMAACLDYRYKRIPVILPAAGMILGGIVFCIGRDRSAWDLFAGILPGSVMVFLSFLTGEKVGYGDGLLLLALGVLLPPELCIMSFCVALILEAVAGLILLILRKVSGKSMIPFLPFLLLGYVVMLGVCG